MRQGKAGQVSRVEISKAFKKSKLLLHGQLPTPEGETTNCLKAKLQTGGKNTTHGG
jgi:hypothetical protein